MEDGGRIKEGGWRMEKREDGGGRAPHTVQSFLPLWDPEKSLIHMEFEINFIPRSHKTLRSSFSLALVVCSYSEDFQWQGMGKLFDMFSLF